MGRSLVARFNCNDPFAAISAQISVAEVLKVRCDMLASSPLYLFVVVAGLTCEVLRLHFGGAKTAAPGGDDPDNSSSVTVETQALEKPSTFSISLEVVIALGGTFILFCCCCCCCFCSSEPARPDSIPVKKSKRLTKHVGARGGA